MELSKLAPWRGSIPLPWCRIDTGNAVSSYYPKLIVRKARSQGFSLKTGKYVLLHCSVVGRLLESRIFNNIQV